MDTCYKLNQATYLLETKFTSSMVTMFYLIVPVIVGISAGAFLAFYPESENGVLLTELKLVEGGSPILGNPSAPITVLEWGDYQCTFCYKFHQTTLKTIENDYVKTGKVKIIFKDFPLNGADSLLAAEASYCAHDQEKYWQFHDELYQNWAGERTGWVNRDSLNIFADEVGIDLKDFNNCLDNHIYQDKVNQLHNFGKEIGIDATPSFLIFNDEKIIKVRGNQPLEVFLKTFDEL